MLAPPEISAELLDLAIAVGLLTRADDGAPRAVALNEAWFADPAGHIKRALTDPRQRAAMLDLAQRALGSAGGDDVDLRDIPAGEQWMALASSARPRAAVYAIVETRGENDVVLSLGARIASDEELAGTRLETAATIAVPIARLRTGAAAELLPAGAIRIGISASAPGGLTGAGAAVGLGGARVDLRIPLPAGEPTLAVGLHGLRLPGDPQPRDISISDPAELEAEVVALLAGLVQAQAASASAELGHLLALLGVRDAAGAAGAIPPLPLADVLARGLPALADWARAVVATPAAVRAWAGELAGLLGAGAVTGGGTDEAPYALEVSATPRLRILLRVLRDTATGAPVLRPAVSLAISSPAGASVTGGASIEAELVALTLGARVTAVALPSLVAAARLGDAATPLLPAGADVGIEQLRAGVALGADRRLTPLLELREVRVGTVRHALLDLSSADAIAEAATDTITTALIAALGPLPEARALAALGGLVRPSAIADGAPWPQLALGPQLLADPVGEIGRYHVRVLAQEGAWGALAAELATLLRTAAGAAPLPAGAGTAAQPWTLELFADGGGEVQLVAWVQADGDRRRLHLGARVALPAVAIGAKQLALRLDGELLELSLPADPSAVPRLDAAFAPAVAIAARLGDDLVLDAGPVALVCDALEGTLRWTQAGGLRPRLRAGDPRLRVDGVDHPLPPLDLELGAGAPALDLAALPWEALEALAGRALAALGPWPAALARMLGWTPGAADLHVTLAQLPGVDIPFAPGTLPRASLQQLAADPAGALRAWLGELLADEGGTLALAGWLSALLPGGTPPAGDVLAARVRGSGTRADPFAIAAGGPELLLWLDPDGPALTGLPGLLEALVPADAGSAPVARLVELLEQAAAFVPQLDALLAGRGDLTVALDALRTRLAGGDGLVAAAAQAPGAPWTTASLGAVAHLDEPAAFDAATHLPAGAPPPARRVFLSAALPGAAPWPGEDAAAANQRLDLGAPGLAPEAFDLTGLAPSGPWFVRLPSRADAGGLAGVVDRLRRALAAMRASAGGPLCVVAHSTTGIAARTLAGEAGISHLVTLGTPHGGATFEWLDRADTGDALRALQALRGALGGTDRGPLDAMLATLGTALDAIVPADDGRPAHSPLPVADFALAPFAPLHADVAAARALAAQTDAAALDAGLAALVASVLEGAASALPGWDGAPVTHAGAGLRIVLPLTPAGETGLAVAATARLDLGRLALAPDGGAGAPPAGLRLELDVQVRRPGGWLAGGPADDHDPSAPRDPRVRWAQLRLSAELEPFDVSAAIVLHEAAAFGIARETWTIDEGLVAPGGDDTGTLVPEARVLLGEIARAAGPLAAGTPGRALADLLAALGLATVAADDTLALLTDPLERMLVDPRGELRARLAADRDALVAALAAWLGIAPPAAGAPLEVALGGGVVLAGTVEPPSLALRAGGVEAGIVRLGGRVEVGASARVQASLEATAGGAALTAAFDSAAGDRLTLALRPRSGREPIALAPVPDAERLAHAAAVLVAGELARLGLEWAQREAPALVDPVLDALRLRGSVRSPAGLLEDPVAWLTGDAGRVTPATLRALLDAARAALDPLAPAGTLRLPWGLALRAGEAAGDALLTLGWAAPVPAGSAALRGSVSLRLGAGFAVTPAAAAGVELTGLAGLDRVALDGALDGAASVTLRLRRTPADADIVIGLVPAAGGLGRLAELATGAVVDELLPRALNALAGHATIGAPVAAAGDALGLRSGGAFSAQELRELASDPPAQLATRLQGAVAPLTAAASDLLAAVLGAGALTAGERSGVPFVQLAFTPAVRLAFEAPADGPPRIVAEIEDAHPIAELSVSARAEVSTGGLGALRASVGVTDPNLLRVGAATALPFAAVDLGGPGARIEAGVWTAAAAAPGRMALVAIFPLAAGGEPRVVRRPGDGSPDLDDLGPAFVEAVRVWLVPLAAELLTDVRAVVARLEKPFAGTSLGEILDAAGILERVAGAEVRYDLAAGALDPAGLRDRVLRLVAHVVELAGGGFGSGPAALHPLTIALASDEHAGRRVYGVRLALAEPLELLRAGGVKLTLETAETPALLAAGDAAGAELLLVSLPAGNLDGDVALRPWLKLNGIGLRAAGDNDGKLVDLVASVDAIALHGVFQANSADGGVQRAGARILLVNFGVPLGAAGGGNPVAQRLLAAGGGGTPGQPATQGDEQRLRPAFSPSLSFLRLDGAAPTVDFRAGEGDGPWWLAIQRRFGPLYVEQVGLGRETIASEDRVKLLLDGGVSLAGLNVGVDDLSVSVPFARPFDLARWRVDLAGLAVGYDGGGVSIAGGLRKRGGTPPDYTGLLLVRAGGFGLNAIGGYTELPVAPGSSDTYTSLFVFAALSAPLGGPPAFFVTGIGGGVGLNRRLILPDDVGRLPSFPLVAAMDPTSPFARDPMGALDGLGAVFPPERGRFWLAAGVRFTSFVLVESLAVLAVELGDGAEVNLLGLSRMSLPTPQVAIARIELALRARFSSRDLVLSVQGQLTDNSYLLHASCRLSGGFAMVSWLRTGQFVLTLGGYHPRFATPAEFPVVPRLAFTWNVSAIVAVKGEAYFALTSTCVMAGGRLEVAYDTSVVKASLTAGIDAIVSWDPFFYDVSAYVRVSARVDIRIWTPFGSVRLRFSLSIGADVRVWGPELRGRARLDLDVISVTVGFGSDDPPVGKEPIGWNAFHEKYLVAGDPQGQSMSAAVLLGQLAPDPGAGRGTADDGSLARPWRVQAEFVLRSETRAASNVVNGVALGSPQALDLGPMHKVGITSTHSVGVRERASGTDRTAALAIAAVRGRVPEAPWRKLPEVDTPAEANMLDALVGATIDARVSAGTIEGTVDLHQVETDEDRRHPLPFGDEIDQRPEFAQDVADAQAYIDAQPRDARTILARAAERLARGGALGGALDARTFAADRVAPPRLAPLAEGMVAPVKPVVATAEVAPPEAPPEPSARVLPPRLRGLLRAPAAGGAAAARAPLRTTVPAEHAKLARRPAPTLAAARSLATALGAARLDLVAPTALAGGATVRAADGGPPTARAGAATELRRGYALAPETARSLEALERTLQAGKPVVLTAGDVQVWELPNAVNDGGDERRPRLIAAGDQLVRLVALDRAGEVLHDETAAKLALELPRGTARLAACGLGAVAGGGDEAPAGLAGWHAGSLLWQVDAASYLGARCSLVATSPDTLRGRRAVDAAIVPGAQAVFGRGAVTTRLPAGTRTLLVALESADRPDDELAGLTLGIEGAKRTSAAPALVVSGPRAHGIFELEPDEGAQAVLATVVSEERWRLAAVAGAAMSAADLAAQLVARGLEALVGAAALSGVGSSELRWRTGGPS